MTHTVSISEFRNNLTSYIGIVSRGDTVIIKDSKKGEEMVTVTKTQKWDPIAHEAVLTRMLENPITAKVHPEWATRAKVEKWLRNTRSSWNRKIV